MNENFMIPKGLGSRQIRGEKDTERSNKRKKLQFQW